MDHLDHPSEELWESRRTRFWAAEELARGEGSYMVSEQASALTADVQAVFCAGAWAGVIILALCVVDAALREAEIPGFRGDTKKLLAAVDAGPELQRLRVRRNQLVHVNPNAPALSVDDQWSRRSELEKEAMEAVELMWKAFYFTPWV
jgi:hypothetical protein